MCVMRFSLLKLVMVGLVPTIHDFRTSQRAQT